ncbi:MAG: copper amine oxidase N-terminal domain-containing protein [Ruminococcaceae bacterium]|nr:copper amine oxidase N-terminal domain-containing protein [Oscillospiraceae bacterium]
MKILLTKEITFSNGQSWLDGSRYEMDTPPQIVNSRTLVPVRAISEALGCEVAWVADIGAVIIN